MKQFAPLGGSCSRLFHRTLGWVVNFWLQAILQHLLRES